ncbi:MAG: class I SAM-dependent methyltransferase [Deltaproteobacteria bacterium]|jgi:hypothetical protein
MHNPGLLNKYDSKIRSIFAYIALLWHNPQMFFPLIAKTSFSPFEKELNQTLIGYPSNHNYLIYNKKIFPKFQLFERFQCITSLFPEKLESLLDIGCCRGFYVLKAAHHPTCNLSVGIDVYEPFITISQKIRAYLNVDKARFHLATLEEVCNNRKNYGGTFQVVLLLGTYHYLFWGSAKRSNGFESHSEILSRLAKICSDRVIFSARLETDRLSKEIQNKAARDKDKYAYTTHEFLECAEEYFDVHRAGYLGRYPLLLMVKKGC